MLCEGANESMLLEGTLYESFEENLQKAQALQKDSPLTSTRGSLAMSDLHSSSESGNSTESKVLSMISECCKNFLDLCEESSSEEESPKRGLARQKGRSNIKEPHAVRCVDSCVSLSDDSHFMEEPLCAQAVTRTEYYPSKKKLSQLKRLCKDLKKKKGCSKLETLAVL